MILHRLGNKTKIADQIIQHFPVHNTYVEPFFGAGGLFFNKPKVQYNIMNDLDNDVFNLYRIVQNNKKELEEVLYTMPFHSGLLDHWKTNKETDPVKKALRFLFLSNFTLYGAMGTFILTTNDNRKKLLYDLIDLTHRIIVDVTFTNWDFRKCIKALSFRGPNDNKKTFIYCDPPYLGLSGNYSDFFTEQDSLDLFDCLEKKGCKWAMSEFNNPFILKQAKERNLNVIEIGERKNIKNRRTEILITNYENNLKPMF